VIDFPLEARKFRARGIAITQRPGEFAVNILNGKPETEQIRETLHDALALAEIIAQSDAARSAIKAATYRAPRRKRMTPKAHNKRMRRKGGAAPRAASRPHICQQRRKEGRKGR
jgi:hypothetical protein